MDCGQEAVFLFHVFFLTFKILTKSVDRWTSNGNSEKIVSTSCIFLFASVDMWTRRSLSISCFLSVIYPSQFWQKSVDRWTSNENSEKKVSISFILLLESVHLWTSSCLSISFFLLSTLYPSKFWQKSVDRWTSNENFWKKFQHNMRYSLKVWTCGQDAVFLFQFFFLSCAF